MAEARGRKKGERTAPGGGSSPVATAGRPQTGTGRGSSRGSVGAADVYGSARVPPQDIDAERATLGAMLLEGEAAGLAIEKLVPADFYRAAHGKIFQSICEICDKFQQPDELVLRACLEAGGILEEVGGSDYVHELATSVPSAANIERYAGIVKERAVARKLISACTASLREAESGGDISDILDRAEQRMYEVAGDRATDDVSEIKDILKEEFEALMHRREHPGFLTGLSTGFKDLDEMTGGLQKSDLIILAARPSVGKSALALTFLDRISCGLDDRQPTLMFTLEMSKKLVGLRMLSSRSGVRFHGLRTGYVSETDFNEKVIGRAMPILSDAPVWIDNTPAIGAAQLRAKARRMKSKHDIKLVVVDYLQLMGSPYVRERNREREVAIISGSLKALACELDIPVLAVSQLRRPSDERRDKQPELMDLRESGALEQDADMVMLLHRDRREDRTYSDSAILNVAKQRNGPTGPVYLRFQGEIMRFVAGRAGEPSDGIEGPEGANAG